MEKTSTIKITITETEEESNVNVEQDGLKSTIFYGVLYTLAKLMKQDNIPFKLTTEWLKGALDEIE